MPPAAPKRPPRRTAVALAAGGGVAFALALVVALAWPLRTTPPAVDAVARGRLAADAAAALDQSPPAARAPSTPADAAARANANANPGGLTAEQWRTVQDGVEPGPRHDREVARIASLLEFQRTVARLRELRGDDRAADERRRLAAEIDAGIEAHLALRETSGPEAVLLKTAVLLELEHDPARRAERLDAWKREWAAGHPPEDDPRVAEYQRREAAIVSDWLARPPSQRDAVDLARRLQQVQVAVFNPGS
jgi:pyruvate/2-oxoglutarate dehydrogenase complex dihydrolipoamide acyltransferase (E2) component